MQKQITLGDIFYEYGERYITNNHPSAQEKGLIRLLSACRTDALGSHFERCNHCDYLGKSYNSCRNRHCPACQQKDKLEWLDKRMGELLPVGYYHLTFTIPHELNPLCFDNKKLMYDILFKAASQTILELAKDPKHLGADTGIITVLHTWGQNMIEHPHLHCIMPAGGLSFDKEYWTHTDKKKDFFVSVKILSKLFKGKFLDLLIQSHDKGLLELKGKLSVISGKRDFKNFTFKLKQKKWVVNIQAPFGKPEKVLEYLSRYVFRIAITDRRIKEIKDGKVHFSWKDYRTGLFSEMKLDIDEFIRRFLLHVLPKGFLKVRYYGIFTNKCRKINIATAKALLEQETADKNEETIQDGNRVWKKQDTVWNEIMECIKNFRKPNCPACKKGNLYFAGIVPKDNLEYG
jgi:hypothetical protein